MRAIAAIGPHPPPLHGMATVHTHVVSAISQAAVVTAIPVMPDAHGGKGRYHFSKFLRAAIAAARLVGARLTGTKALYCAVDAGLGGYYTAVFALIGRSLGMELFLHHHNYNYCIQAQRPMQMVVRAAGRSARHIVLCDRMAHDLKALYPTVGPRIIVPNTAPLPRVPDRSRKRRAGELRIGLLSNLTPAKGPFEFMDIVARLNARGLPVTGVLAGPAIDSRVADAIERRMQEPAARIEWLGRVEGEGKAAFFADIDLFVFPTHMEAFGLVLLEALAHGVPILAPAHGCICLFNASPAASILATDLDFVEAACDHIVAAGDAFTAPQRAGEARGLAEAIVGQGEAAMGALVGAMARFSSDSRAPRI